jgi:hypothetical protein
MPVIGLNFKVWKEYIPVEGRANPDPKCGPEGELDDEPMSAAFVPLEAIPKGKHCGGIV